jgi:hypothetical protein
MHYENAQWVDCTTVVDTQNQTVCGAVTSLSPFAIMLAGDTTPPTISSVSASPDILWPANHKMIAVAVTVQAVDDHDPVPKSTIVGVTSNEPINGPGDGNTTPDWQTTDDPLVVLLRAERSGSDSGRVYTIEVNCTDASGNTTTGTVNVTVPHDRGKGKK